MSMGVKEVTKVIIRISEVIEGNKEFLTELDAAIGDADHGINMNKGFKAVKEKLNTASLKDVGEVLKLVAMTLISNVGGASGPLYGTAFLKASIAAAGKKEITIEDFRIMLDVAVEGIKMRGKAVEGDKTMLDALEPALRTVKLSIENNESIIETLKKAKDAALAGVNYTKEISAKKGRASYLGDRSIGHQDPGATSSYLILNSIYNTALELAEL